jgi:hypothetical protein
MPERSVHRCAEATEQEKERACGVCEDRMLPRFFVTAGQERLTFLRPLCPVFVAAMFRVQRRGALRDFDTNP